MGQIIGTVLLEKGLRAEFMKAFENGENPTEVLPLITSTPSKAASEKFGWLGNVPNLEQWIDQRKLHGLYEYSYTITNKDYEATLQVDRNEIEDDQLGGIKIRISDLAKKAKLHPRKLFFDAIIAGTTDLCYDGQAFFSNSHSSGVSGTQDNLLAGTGIDTIAHLQADFNAAVAAMRGFKDDQGEPYNEGELDLYVVAPSGAEAKFRELLNASMISSTTNTLAGAAKLIVSSRLAANDVNDWYLFDASGVVKPFIKLDRKAPEFAALESGSDRGFMSKRYLYGIDYRVGFGYGLWQKAVKTVNS